MKIKKSHINELKQRTIKEGPLGFMLGGLAGGLATTKGFDLKPGERLIKKRTRQLSKRHTKK